MQDVRKAKVREQFGASADEYAKSEIHAKGESLSLLVDLVKPQKEWRALDIATGAGHTAMAIAPRVKQMVATDITREMLQKTYELASSHVIKNIDLCMVDAESLPFKENSFDLVTCRIALHHFSDARSAIREAVRVLKPGSIFGLADNVVIDDGQMAAYYNAFEKIRDPSHNWVYTFTELRSILEDEGLKIEATRRITKEMEFQEWANRQHVSEPDKERLMSMLHSLPAPLQSMLRPRYADGTTYFSLFEAVIIAKKDTVLLH